VLSARAAVVLAMPRVRSGDIASVGTGTAKERVLRILILEDDPLIALDLQLLVESAGHQVVRVCGDLSTAHRHLGAGFDFALLDVDLPDGKSFEVAARLDEKRIPFVFVSASALAELPAHLRHAPFIAKPYQHTAIINSLRAA
jgi:CheY-like chemotaxis protein